MRITSWTAAVVLCLFRVSGGGDCLELLAAEFWMSAHSSTPNAQTSSQGEKLFFRPFQTSFNKKKANIWKELSLTSLRLSDQSPFVFFVFSSHFLPSNFVPPRPLSANPSTCVIGACYKAESPAVPFRSKRCGRCAHQLSDNQDLNLLTTMTCSLYLD